MYRFAPDTTSGGPSRAFADAETPDHYIPGRKAALLEALLADERLVDPSERERFSQMNRLIECVFHFEYFARLERLRQAYVPVDPEADRGETASPEEFVRDYDAFVAQFVEVLEGGNFVEVGPTELQRALSEHAALRVTLNTPLDDFHALRYFRRGRGVEAFEVSRWNGLRKQRRDIEVYQHVVVVAAIKPRQWLDDSQAARLERGKIVPGSVLIKCFRNIASADLDVLLPNVRVRMTLFDKLVMAVPALVGGVPIVLKLVSSLTVLFVVIGFYLGLRRNVHDEEMKTALAALGALVAFGALMIRQWVRYERHSLKYLKEITDKVFFRSVNHNAGFFDYILGAAEDQDHKETLLAYVLLRRSGPQTPEALAGDAEAWLNAFTGLPVRFNALDALGKLQRFGLVDGGEGGYRAVPLGEAVARLQRVWHGFFPIEPPVGAGYASVAGRP